MKRTVWWALTLAGVLWSGAVVAMMFNLERVTPLGIAIACGILLLTTGYPVFRLVKSKPGAAGDWAPSEPLREGSSEVAWISDHVWRRARQTSRHDGHGFAGDDAWTVAEVDAGERGRSVATKFRAAGAQQTLEAAQQALLAGPRAGAVWNSSKWPYCCGQLAVLERVNPTKAELKDWENERGVSASELSVSEDWTSTFAQIRSGRRPEPGTNLFTCGGCGRAYLRLTHT